MVPTGSSLGLGDTIQDTGVLYGIDTERYTYYMVPNLLGCVPAPWVGLAMYTLGYAPLPAGLGPASAGWAAAPGGCVWLWVRGLGLSVSFLLCGAGFNLLGGPPPLLPSAQWPRVWPVVPVCGVLVRRLPGCAVACFG